MKRMISLLMLVTPYIGAVSPTNLELDQIAHKCWTDKGSWGHNYVEQYDKHFAHLRDKNIKLLEIGFYQGASAYMWEAYFSRAALYHIDIEQWCYQYAKTLSNRSKLHMVDQSSPEQLRKYVEEIGGNFDIIIDDGSHMVQHQIISFKTLFPFLKSGGIYVIEDLFSSYWKEYGGNGSKENPATGPNSTISFLKQLLDDVNQVGARNAYANIDVCPKNIVDSLTYYQKNIKEMHFSCNLCFIIKR